MTHFRTKHSGIVRMTKSQEQGIRLMEPALKEKDTLGMSGQQMEKLGC